MPIKIVHVDAFLSLEAKAGGDADDSTRKRRHSQISPIKWTAMDSDVPPPGVGQLESFCRDPPQMEVGKTGWIEHWSWVGAWQNCVWEVHAGRWQLGSHKSEFASVLYNVHEDLFNSISQLSSFFFFLSLNFVMISRWPQKPKQEKEFDIGKLSLPVSQVSVVVFVPWPRGTRCHKVLLISEITIPSGPVNMVVAMRKHLNLQSDGN